MFFQRFIFFLAGASVVFFSFFSCTGSEKNNTDYRLDKDNPVQNMVFVPAGEFIMGSADEEAAKDEKPPHKIFLPAYYIDKYEVTNSEYQKFVIETGHPAPYLARQWALPYNWNGESYPEGKGDYPVVLVSWRDAQAYARWAGKRLPTEAEWEKACRGGLAGKKYPLAEKLKFNQANFDKGYIRGSKSKPVGNFAPNGFGLHDMAGNVWEWCHDWYSETYYKASPAESPPGPDKGLYRVFRGGSWKNTQKFLRCSQRGKSTPGYKSYTLGFRCALSAQKNRPQS